MTVEAIGLQLCNLTAHGNDASPTDAHTFTQSPTSERATLLKPLMLFLLLHFLSAATALSVSAPEKCGGSFIVTHATASFGPKPSASFVRDILLFAPRAQADGNYIRAIKPPRRSPPRHLPTRSLIMGVLFGDPRRRSRTTPKPEPPLPPPQPPLQERDIDDDIDAADAADAADFARFGIPDVDNHADVELEGRGPIEEQPQSGEEAILRATEMDERLPGAADPSILPVRLVERDALPDAPFNLFHACQQLSVPADFKTTKGRVAVVARGVCDFAQKVGLMQDAGAVGVIVVNFNDESEPLANMKLNDTKENPKIHIPAVMIGYKDWASIAPCRNDTRVSFTAEGEATFDMDYGRDALNWAMMRGMALWILCQCGVNVVRYKRRVSEFRARADAIAALPVDTYERAMDREETVPDNEEPAPIEDVVTEPIATRSPAGPAPGSPVMDHDPERIRLVPSDAESAAPSSSSTPAQSSASTAVEETESHEEDPVCAVCLEEFETGQQVRQLACSHLYHRTCIDPWLQSSSNCCPLCKREVPNLPPPPSQVHYGSMVV